MSEVAAEHRRKETARPESDAATEFQSVDGLPSGSYGASIWDPSHQGTFGTVEDAAASVKLAGGRKRSKFRGVSRTSSGKYGAVISHSKGTARTWVWLGSFETAEEAARAYDTAAVKLRGARAITNFGAESRCTICPTSVVPGSRDDDLSAAEWKQVHELFKDMDSTHDKEALIEAAAILHHIALAGRHGDGGRGEPT